MPLLKLVRQIYTREHPVFAGSRHGVHAALVRPGSGLRRRRTPASPPPTPSAAAEGMSPSNASLPDEERLAGTSSGPVVRSEASGAQIEQLRTGAERLLEAYGLVRQTLQVMGDELQRAEPEAYPGAVERANTSDFQGPSIRRVWETPLSRDASQIDAARSFASARKRPVLSYFLPPHEPIDTANVREVAHHIGDRHFDELDFMLNSRGGDIHSAYQLVTFLRRRATKLNACVPRYAQGAATLLCLGSDTIILDDLAAIGPLDAQIRSPKKSDSLESYQSALNYFKSLERLRDFSLETVLRGSAEILRDADMQKGTDESLRQAMEFVRVAASPLIEKVETERLGDYGEALAISEAYANRVLARRAVPEEQRRAIITRLVHGYPSHEYVIDRQELQELGLVAELFEGEDGPAARALADHETMRMIALIDPDTPSVEGYEVVSDRPGEVGKPLVT